MKLTQFIYVSAAPDPFTRVDLQELLRRSRMKNQRLEVTGMLLHHAGSFMQVLEGPEWAIEPLVDTLENDPCQSKPTLLLRREISSRNFEDWKLGFVDVTTQSQSPPGFCDYFLSHSSLLDLTGEPKTVARVVDGFRDGQWRQYIEPEQESGVLEMLRDV